MIVERDRDRARAVAQVPERERAVGVRDLRDPLGVEDEGRAVVDLRERDQRGVVVDQLLDVLGLGARVGVGLDPFDLELALGGEALEHVAVGREVVAVGDDLGAVGARVERGARELVEADRGRVGDRGLAGRGPEQLGTEPVADRRREVHPSLAPGANQPLAPLLLDHLLEPLERLLGKSPERVAVQVDQPVGRDEEALVKRRERILGVERGCLIAAATARRASPWGRRHRPGSGCRCRPSASAVRRPAARPSAAAGRGWRAA